MGMSKVGRSGRRRGNNGKTLQRSQSFWMQAELPRSKPMASAENTTGTRRMHMARHGLDGPTNRATHRFSESYAYSSAECTGIPVPRLVRSVAISLVEGNMVVMVHLFLLMAFLRRRAQRGSHPYCSLVHEERALA